MIRLCQAQLVYSCLQATLERVGRRGNTTDLDVQPFYKFIQKTYTWHVVTMFAALYAVGGFPAVVWGGALRVAWVYHITWFVNSASHCWGTQTYNTGDLSRNNWCAPFPIPWSAHNSLNLDQRLDIGCQHL